MQNTASILKIFLIVAVILLIAGYSYNRTKDFIRGPTITIFSPADGATFTNTLVEIKGGVKNISYISINDRQIFTNEEGFFVEKLLLYPGYNIISIKASDKFERKIEKTLELIYKEPKQKLEISIKKEGETDKTIMDRINPALPDQDTKKDKEIVELLN